MQCVKKAFWGILNIFSRAGDVEALRMAMSFGQLVHHFDPVKSTITGWISMNFCTFRSWRPEDETFAAFHL